MGATLGVSIPGIHDYIAYLFEISIIYVWPLWTITRGHERYNLSVLDKVREWPQLGDDLEDLSDRRPPKKFDLRTSRHTQAKEYTSPANVHCPPSRTSGGIHLAAPPCQVLMPIVLFPASASLASPKSARCTELFSSRRMFAYNHDLY